jgi:hypothetical protein
MATSLLSALHLKIAANVARLNEQEIKLSKMFSFPEERKKWQFAWTLHMQSFLTAD